MPTLPAAISRSAMTVGLSRSASTSGAAAGGDLARAVGGRERQLEAVGNLLETVVDRDAGHGILFGGQGSSKRCRSCAWRTACRGAVRRAARTIARQVVDGSSQSPDS